MCDLINLESPDGKTLSGPKLASPLIPAPSTTSSEDKSNLAASSSASLNFEKRNSLDNNPFDNAHHKTVEYTSKKEDPFEVALEKALMYENRGPKVSASKARTVEFKDDFTPKKRRYSDILKMNKTLDDSLTDLQSNVIREAKKKHYSTKDGAFKDSPYGSSLISSGQESKSDLGMKFPLPDGPKIPSLRVESVSLDSSILNQSAMNDSLTESGGGGVDENLLKSVMSSRMNEKIRAAARNPDYLVVNEEVKKFQKLRRSMSQGDRESPKKFRQRRCRSIVDNVEVGGGNDDGSFVLSVPSIFFEDSMNKAFLQSVLSGNNASVFSNISNVSSISRLTSVSSGFNSSNSSSAFSNRMANCAFIESSDGIVGDSGETNDCKLPVTSRLRSSGSVTSMMKSPIEESGEEKELNDLILKYSKLRTKSNESATSEISPLTRIPSVVSGSGIFADKFISPKIEDKLIDVDVFVPQSKESPEGFHGKSGSSTSSDSVFIDSDTIEKSICSEAKTLARTFEELAAKTGSSSTSSDDLINSRPYPNFNLLPLSDDEVLVDDLIELKKSPVKCDTETAKSREKIDESTSSSSAKSEKSMLKDLETKLIDSEKKISASTLLLELENLVKSENNPEATELLKSLEKALGVSCESNADLLAKCLSVRNDLSKSPNKIDNSTENENIKNENKEKSHEDNTEVETCKSFEQLSLSNDDSLKNNFNVEKEINKSDKSLILVSEKNDESPTDKRQQMNGKEDSSEKINDDSIEAIKEQNQITDDQKIAVELLVGLGKLLTSESKDPVTSTLLKNLGIALNLASSSNNCDHDVDARSSVKETKRLGVKNVKNRVATPPRKSAPLSAFTRPANRRSLELSTKAKTTGDRVVRRSTSVTRSPPTSTTTNISRLPITPLSADKTKAHLKDGRKRFSSDPSSDVKSVNDRKLTKDITLKPVAMSELARQDKPSSTVVDGVKNKLRKKSEPNVGSKKGPMKAILPLGNMQRRGSFLKKETSSNESVTPPKPGEETPSAFTVTTSTPFPIVRLSVPKKVSKSKPIASSTPDDVGTKHHRRSASQIPQSPGKNSFSCNISPVTSKMRENNDDNNSRINSSSSKTSKIGTPPMPRPGSQLPRLSPMLGTKSNRGQRRSEPLPSFLPRGTPKSPGGRLASDGSTSPLNNSNKLGSQVKPLNLISKLDRRRADKENYA